MEDPERMANKRAKLEKFWDINTKQGALLKQMNKGHTCFRRWHQLLWNDYGEKVVKCRNLQREIAQEQERSEDAAQVQGARAADVCTRCWEPEELKGTLACQKYLPLKVSSRIDS